MFRLFNFLIFSALVIGSYFVVVYGVGNEPFFYFEIKDAWIQLILSTIFLVLWVEFLIFVFFQIINKKLRKKVLILNLGVMFIIYCLVMTSILYMEDLIEAREYRELIAKKKLEK